mmetsp:Transcript_2401/g.3759  ORF Transcript_2401/g.3759 Transcript_2401/m.3759 type:complete len:492 (-) Transcript_2401:131-1606(-)
MTSNEHHHAHRHGENRETPDRNANDFVITIDRAIDKLGTGRFQHRILFAAGLCFAADAMEVMLLAYLSLVLEEEWGLSGTQTATITACVFAGAMTGTLILGPLGDKVGRRPVFLLAGTIITVFGVLTSFVTNFVGMVLVRFCVGLGIGGLTVPYDILAEFLPTETRARYLLMLDYFWTAGVVLVTVIAYFTIGAGISWRVYVLICAIPCLASVVLGIFLVPESPRWLALHQRNDEALAILRSAARINGHDPDIIFPDTQRLHQEREENASFSELFVPKWRKLTISIWGVWFGFTYGYYGAMIVITRVFGKDINGDSIPDFDYASIFLSSLAEAVGLSIIIYAVDKIGRVWAQVLSYGIGGIFLFLFCILADTASKPVLTSLAFAVRGFEMAGVCVTWVATAEILPTEIRSTGHSAANAVARIGGFVCPYLISGFSLYTVGVVLLAIHISTCIFAYNLPETKDKKMGEMSPRGDRGYEFEFELPDEGGYDRM